MGLIFRIFGMGIILGGVGAEGEGEEGQTVWRGQQGSGKGQGGDQQGQHLLEVDVSLEELAGYFGEELHFQPVRI